MIGDGLRVEDNARVELVDIAWLRCRTPGEEFYLREPRLVSLFASCGGEPGAVIGAAREVGDIRSPEVAFFLHHLVERGVLCAVTPDSPRCSDLIDPSTAPTRHCSGISYVGCPRLPWLEQRLRGMQGKSSCVEMVVTCDYLSAELLDVVRRIHEKGRSAVLIRPFGPIAWLGPHLRPQASPCLQCVQSRLRQNLTTDSYYMHIATSSSGLDEDAVRSLSDAISARLRHDQDKRLEDDLSDAIVTLGPRPAAMRTHRLAPLPQCHECGVGGDAFGSCSLDPLVDQPFDSSVAEDYLADPLTGVMGDIVRLVEGGSEDIHVYVAPLAFASPSQRTGLNSNRTIFVGGKGTTASMARDSAFYEGIERYSGLYDEGRPTCEAEIRDLQLPALSPQTLQQFSAEQFATRESWNGAHHSSARVPEQWAPDVPLHWSRAWSLSRRAPCLVPTAIAYYATPWFDEGRCCLADSNGSAAGRTQLDAVLDGMLEVIERDAAATWWYNRLALPSVELSSIDAWLSKMLTVHRSLGRVLHLIQLPTDFPVAVFAAVSNSTSIFRPVIGLGCHFDVMAAAHRAVAEANQKLPVAMRAFDFPSNDPLEALWHSERRSELTSLLEPSQRTAPLSEPDPVFRGLPTKERVLGLVDVARHLQIEVVTVNQTRPDTRIHVAKVFMTGMRPIWPRLAEGRLYDLPVRLGLRTTPLRESELLQVPLLL